MTQNYSDIPSTQTLQSSRQLILDRDDAAASNFSGTAFPTTGLLVGMRCHRTDLGKVYALKATSPSATWVEVEDVNGTSGLAPQATKLATARTFAASGDATATGVTFDGTGNVTLALSLAASGVTAGTYTKVTVDAKGRVTSGAAIATTDLPSQVSVNSLRATSTTGLSLNSTGHAFQIGADTGLNIAADLNDIQSRNNEAASTLYLNRFGGNVSIGDNSASVLTLGGSVASSSLALATLAEAEAGTATDKLMTPQKTAQAIAALAAKPAYYLTMTASGTWTKPTGFAADTMVVVELWGGGGGGGYNAGSTSAGSGGSGGCYVIGRFRYGNLPSTVAVGVGLGGAAGNLGGDGGNTTFGTYLTAYGGGGGIGSGSSTSGTSLAGGLFGQTANAADFFTGGLGGANGAATAPGGAAFMGGGGGAGASSNNGSGVVYQGGTSVGGGAGGNGGRNVTATAGAAPGGGGGGACGSAGTSAAGARGEARIWIG